MKKDVVKELNQTLEKRKEKASNNAVLSQAQKLLECDSARDINILRGIGENSTFVQSENERGELLEIEKKEQFYSGKVFTKQQIVELGAKYRLKFLNSGFFKSYIDPLVALDIKDLERKISESMEAEQAQRRNMTIEEYRTQYGATKFQFDDHQLTNKFYILGHPKCFITDKKKAFTLFAPDPILFYTDDEKHFRLVRKWGSDFTVFRRLIGLVMKNPTTLFFSMFIMMALVGLTVSILSNIWFFMATPIFLIFALVPAYDTDLFGEYYVTSISSY